MIVSMCHCLEAIRFAQILKNYSFIKCLLYDVISAFLEFSELGGNRKEMK